jgi:hypothetical protein
MNKPISILFAFLMAAAGCTSVHESADQLHVGKSYAQGPKVAAIEVLPTKSDAVKNVSGLGDISLLFGNNLKKPLIPMHPDWQIRMAGEAAGEPTQDLTIKTEILQIDGGSAAMRFWVGFGAGAVSSTVKISVVDNTGRLLASSEITERTICPMGACTEDNKTIVLENLDQLAVAAATFISDPAAYEKARSTDDRM